jgi:hypothetical protein
LLYIPTRLSGIYWQDVPNQPVGHERKIMTTAKSSTVIGVFTYPGNAQDAIRDLRQLGFLDAHFGLVSPHKDKEEAAHKGAKTATGAAAGAAAVGTGAALWSLGISFGMVPVVGPILAAGPLAAALISGAGGAAAGGLIGGLTGLGIGAKDAKFYETELNKGRTLVTVHAEKREDEAWKVMELHNAYNHDHVPATV